MDEILINIIAKNRENWLNFQELYNKLNNESYEIQIFPGTLECGLHEARILVKRMLGQNSIGTVCMYIHQDTDPNRALSFTNELKTQLISKNHSEANYDALTNTYYFNNFHQ